MKKEDSLRLSFIVFQTAGESDYAMLDPLRYCGSAFADLPYLFCCPKIKYGVVPPLKVKWSVDNWLCSSNGAKTILFARSAVSQLRSWEVEKGWRA